MTVHLCASHPDHAQFGELAYMIAVLTNLHISGLDPDVPEAELAAMLAALHDAMQYMIEHYEYLPDGIAGQVKRAEARLVDNGGAK